MDNMIEEEVEILRKKTDDEIMKLFAKHLFGNFPFMVRVDALKIVMKEREIESTYMTVIVAFKTHDGIKEIRINEC